MIAIISAMQEEMQALLEQLKNTKETTKGMRTYYQGSLFGKKVVLVFSRWGKVAAAATTTQLINDYSPSEIIFTGVAGAIKPHLNIGDVIIGTKLYQHDLDARPFYQKFEVPILKEKYFGTVNPSSFMDSALKLSKAFNEFVSESEAKEFNIVAPKVYTEAIASGDLFVSSLEKIAQLNNELPDVCCVEMEGASVAQVCFEYNVPFNIIRIISDKANDNAHIDFARFMKNVASQYALGIFKNYFVL
ncbi:5'-methylthioadenosine/adenosylhomocysteine nucleosidase [Urechidicola sp. KH5]